MIYVATSALLSAVPVVTSLPLGEDYVDQDLSATLNYTTINGLFSDSIPLIDLTIGTPDTMKLGVQPVSVTYLDYATSFNLTITNTGATVGEVVVPSDLFFSEYIEGSSNNKAIEIQWNRLHS